MIEVVLLPIQVPTGEQCQGPDKENRCSRLSENGFSGEHNGHWCQAFGIVFYNERPDGSVDKLINCRNLKKVFKDETLPKDTSRF